MTPVGGLAKQSISIAWKASGRNQTKIGSWNSQPENVSLFSINFNHNYLENATFLCFPGFLCNLEKFFLYATTCSFFVNDVREGLGGRDRTKRANIFSSVRTHFFEVYSLSKIMEVENFPKQKETKIGDIQFPTSMIMRGRAFPSSMFFLNFLENTGTPEKSIRMPSRRRKRQSIAWRIKRSS